MPWPGQDLSNNFFFQNGLVNVVLLLDESLREKLTRNDYATVVFKYNEITKEIETTEEKELLKELVSSLPKIDQIGPDELKVCPVSLICFDDVFFYYI